MNEANSKVATSPDKALQPDVPKHAPLALGRRPAQR